MSNPEQDPRDMAEEQARWVKVWRETVIEYMDIAQDAEGAGNTTSEKPDPRIEKITPHPDLL